MLRNAEERRTTVRIAAGWGERGRNMIRDLAWKNSWCTEHIPAVSQGTCKHTAPPGNVRPPRGTGQQAGEASGRVPAPPRPGLSGARLLGRQLRVVQPGVDVAPAGQQPEAHQHDPPHGPLREPDAQRAAVPGEVREERGDLARGAPVADQRAAHPGPRRGRGVLHHHVLRDDVRGAYRLQLADVAHEEDPQLQGREDQPNVLQAARPPSPAEEEQDRGAHDAVEDADQRAQH
mmetsp:Transcript_61213/g.158864  ORF Transcript_61213/g.158864 Transcript_61213/m.158864 type:complete len:233 (-) Transcript_61213:162-860(-)